MEINTGTRVVVRQTDQPTIRKESYKVAVVTEMEVVHGLDNMDFHSPRALATAVVECQMCQQQRTTLSPRYGTIAGDHPVTWWQVDI